jgi:hypothetical protein
MALAKRSSFSIAGNSALQLADAIWPSTEKKNMLSIIALYRLRYGSQNKELTVGNISH